MADNAGKPMRTGRWAKIIAAVCDFFTAYFGFTFLVAFVTGGFTETGVKLSGIPAAVALGLIVLYFWLGRSVLGGTIWQRILKVRY